MSELTVKDLEVTREIPGNPPEKGGPAKIVKVSFEEDEREPEIFATARTHLPSKGDKVPVTDLEFNQQWSRWQFKRKSQDGRGGRSPEETKRIVIQHSQTVAAMREANLVASGKGMLTDDQWQRLVGWLTSEVYGKQTEGVIGGLFQSDVPFDDKDMVP